MAILKVCSILLPERFGDKSPCTFGTHLRDSPESPPLTVFFNSASFLGVFSYDSNLPYFFYFVNSFLYFSSY